MKILSSEITSYSNYINRRSFLKKILASFAAVSSNNLLYAKHQSDSDDYEQYTHILKNEKINTYQEITNYNNFYEFGTNKSDPAKYSSKFITKPWSITVEGMVKNPGIYPIEDILKHVTIEDRLYRLRCVEGWSMVIPWQGFPLNKFIRKLEPLNNAKYIQFETIYRPSEMPGQKRNVLPWPYLEGLRMDEAMHPLTILSTGLYGHDLLNQNGAPIRLVIPWKYGFKSIKSISKIRFVGAEPKTTWAFLNPREYGFYSNVNPAVDHPRWSQATERRIGDFYRRPTLLFNGYDQEVAYLYKGMDLTKYY